MPRIFGSAIMRVKKLSRRIEKRLRDDFAAAKSKTKYLDANGRFRIHRSTLHEHVNSSLLVLVRVARKAFTAGKQSVLVELMLKYEHIGALLTRAQFMDGVQLFLRSFTDDRQFRLIFKDSRPELHLLRNFERLNRGRLVIRRPSTQEANRARSCNAEVFTSHFSNLSKLFEVYQLDAVSV